MSRNRIPPLRVLCLRAVGPHGCNPETQFGDNASASKLLRSFHECAVNDTTLILPEDSNDATSTAGQLLSLLPTLSRIPYSGPGSIKRSNANEVDIVHPFCAQRFGETLVLSGGNVASDVLQSYLDSMVELGRMDDTRLGVTFWKEWKFHTNPTKKRKLSSPILASLSLHNASIGENTVAAMVKSGMGDNLGNLDLTGSHTLTDNVVETLLQHCPNLKRLSLKSCRRLTNASLQSVVTYCPNMTCLDVGGTYNMTTSYILDCIPQLDQLEELYASGLGWTDQSLAQLVEIKSDWKGLGLAFSLVSGGGIRMSLAQCVELEILNISFCETACDASLLGYLGRSLPHVKALDIRGNNLVTSLTGWFDGRLQLQAEAQELFVLARYAGISKQSIEETQRIHPVQASMLTCVIDASGTGGAIR